MSKAVRDLLNDKSKSRFDASWPKDMSSDALPLRRVIWNWYEMPQWRIHEVITNNRGNESTWLGRLERDNPWKPRPSSQA